MLLIQLLEVIETEEEKSKFKKFYYKYVGLVMHVSLKRLDDYRLAEENCQDVFFALAKHFEKVGEVDSEETRAYVYTVANSLAINKYNKEIVHQVKEIPEINVESLEDEKFDLHTVSELQNAVANLSEDEKAYLRLKYIYGYTLKEIADIFDESTSTVERKLRAIKAALSERLG